MQQETDGRRIVRVRLRLPSERIPKEAARVRVQIIDDSRADAPSPVVSETVLSDVALTSEGTEDVDVEVPAALIESRNRYSVSVHIDVSGSGKVERGDLITVQSYPVLTRGYPDDVAVDVRPV